MAIKFFEIDGIGKIRVQKRRGSRAMRIKLAQDGTVSVVIPNWIPYKVALDYAKNQSDWINKHRPIKKTLVEGQQIGKDHTISVLDYVGTKPKIKVSNNLIVIHKPENLFINDDVIQRLLIKASRNALKKQTYILELKIHSIAKKLDYKFDSVTYKFMKSKWGSCNSNKIITLNYRLLDLPDDLIEYVLVHELVHLNHMNHSKNFWDELSSHLPDYKARKLELKRIQLDW